MDSIERITGSSRDDTLTGDDGRNVLYGGSGYDVISGGARNDVIRGGPGPDILDGGEGIDTLDYRDAGRGIFISLDREGRGQFSIGNDQFDDAFGFENIQGTQSHDGLYGNRHDNRLWGGAELGLY